MRTGGIIRDLKSDNSESFETTRALGRLSQIRIVHFKISCKMSKTQKSYSYLSGGNDEAAMIDSTFEGKFFKKSLT